LCWIYAYARVYPIEDKIKREYKMRVTKKQLYNSLDKVNQWIPAWVDKYDLNHNSVYGGWELTTQRGSHVIQHRIPAREMKAYLDGMKEVIRAVT
tara:strand:+ start:356 stop:640 length:285 start_codon:yes stop_codon:yes gene_type:complete